ncbi:hypothetical protein [Actinophytocola sp.]|uniref:hypothetical protein n=1 Tax=Actinophytocola sp. TaxID=1872138 RepID=UPI002ECFDEFC
MPFMGLDPQLATELATEMRTAAAGADEQAAITRQALALAGLSSPVPVQLMEIVGELTIASDVIATSAGVVSRHRLDPGTEAAMARGLWALALGPAAATVGEELTDIDAALANFSLVYRLPEPTSITDLIIGIPTTDPKVRAALARLDTWLLPVLKGERGRGERGEQEKEDLLLLLGMLNVGKEELMVREEEGDRHEFIFSFGAGVELLAERVEADRRFFEYGLLPDIADLLPEDYDSEDTTDLDWLPAALAGRAEVPLRPVAVLEFVKLAMRYGYRRDDDYGSKLTAKDLRDESREALALLAKKAMTYLRGTTLLANTVVEGTERPVFSSTAITAQIRYGAARGAITDGAIANAAKRADTAFGPLREQFLTPEVMQGPPTKMSRAAFDRAVMAEVGHIADYEPSGARRRTAAYSWVHQAGSLAEQRERMLSVLLSWRSHALAGPAMMTKSEQHKAFAEFHPDLPKELDDFMGDADRLNKVVKYLGVPGYEKIKLTDAYRLHLTNDSLGRGVQVQMEHRPSAGFGYVLAGLGVVGVFFPPAAVIGGAMQAIQAAANDDWTGALISAAGAVASVASAGGAVNAARAAYAVQGAAIAARAIDAGDTMGAVTAVAGAVAGDLGVTGFQNTSRAIGAGIATVGVVDAIDEGDLLRAVEHTASAVGQVGTMLGAAGEGSMVTDTLSRVERFARAARGVRDEDPVLIASALRQEIVGLASAATGFVTRTVENLNDFARDEPETIARIDELAELPAVELDREKDALAATANTRGERLADIEARLDRPVDSEERRELTRERDYLRYELTGLVTELRTIETAQQTQEFRAQLAPVTETERPAPVPGVELQPRPVPIIPPSPPRPPVPNIPPSPPRPLVPIVQPSPPRPPGAVDDPILPSPPDLEPPAVVVNPSPPQAGPGAMPGSDPILPPPPPQQVPPVAVGNGAAQDGWDVAYLEGEREEKGEIEVSPGGWAWGDTPSGKPAENNPKVTVVLDEYHFNLLHSNEQQEFGIFGNPVNGTVDNRIGLRNENTFELDQNGLMFGSKLALGVERKTEHTADFGMAEAKLETEIAAGAFAEGGMTLNGNGVEAKAEYLLGLRFGGTLEADIGGIGVAVTGEAWAGAGAEGMFSAGKGEDGRWHFGSSVGGGMGVGGKGGFMITIDPDEVSDTANEAADAIGTAITSYLYTPFDN